MFKKLKNRIKSWKSKKGKIEKIKSKFRFKLNEEYFSEIWEELEMILLENNVALEVVEKIRENIKKKLIGKEIKKKDVKKEIQKELKESLEELLIPSFDLIEKVENSKKPFKIIFFGVNGSGKTTTIAKVASLLKKQGFSVVLAASDTFRAASIEQLEKHSEKLNAKLIKGEYGTDPASISYDAIKHAESKNKDVVLIDTAGRMHTEKGLMEEMKKICRVNNPDLKIFIAESITGNDAIEQSKSFKEVGIDASILTKADIDEKGGTILSISYITKKPILYLGIGQEYKNLEKFEKEKILGKLGI